MNEYKDLEDCLYNLVEGLFPEWPITFAYGNGPEPTTPDCVIDVMKWTPVGQPYTSHLGEVDINSPVGNARTMTFQDIVAKVRFDIAGKADANTVVSEMAHNLQTAMRTPLGYELMKRNRLALHGQISTRRMPVKRDTDTYMCYQIDCTFAYCSVTQDDIDWIAITDVGGTYHDAGREPDHIIKTHVDIVTPQP
ncbi:hypothetical protein vBPFY1MI_01 [Pseudomonas phage vB_PF_Y1-MI]|nr:hypothetical protein vBPFY1MI_01 [Pseudomonas phage vB_PF_Y1-MI]